MPGYATDPTLGMMSIVTLEAPVSRVSAIYRQLVLVLKHAKLGE